MPYQAFLVSITGRVQGVGFRMWTERQAQALELHGWVKNEPDGSVAALVGGPVEAVARLLELLHAGPPSARVTGVTTNPADPANLPSGFRQIR